MIEVIHIKKTYGKKVVLQDINFKAYPGECIAIVGSNGCGKSTLLQVMTGVIKADKGDILYFGENTKTNKNIFRKYCGYVPQENPLIEELSVRDNLKLWGANKEDNYQTIIEQFQLQELLKMSVEKLSGGMKRRLSIACALLESPQILLMDEPTTALDIYYKESIRELICTYQKNNGIVIMTTHDEQEIMAANRCLVMNKGRMIELETGEHVLSDIRKYIAAVSG